MNWIDTASSYDTNSQICYARHGGLTVKIYPDKNRRGRFIWTVVVKDGFSLIRWGTDDLEETRRDAEKFFELIEDRFESLI